MGGINEDCLNLQQINKQTNAFFENKIKLKEMANNWLIYELYKRVNAFVKISTD